MYFTPPLARLIEEFQKFPGVGPKSAQRMAFFVLNMSTQDVANLSRVLVDAKDKVKHCSNCFHLSANDPCEICTNDKRDIKTICVVADSRDVIALEKHANTKALTTYSMD